MPPRRDSQPDQHDNNPQSRRLLRLVHWIPSRKSKRRKDMCPPADPSKSSTVRPLHFVNTDATSIGTKDPEKRTTRSVKSHLSGHYRRWKKQQTLSAQAAQHQQQQQQSNPKSDTSSLAPTGIKRLGQPSLKTAPRQEPCSLSSSSSTSSSTSSPSPGDDRRLTRIATHARHTCETAYSATLRNPLSLGNSDPFGALPLPVDPKTNMFLQLFHRGTTVVCWAPTGNVGLKDMMHDEGVMQGILAISKMIAATYLPACPADSSVLLPESRRHYGELLRVMRTYFKDGPMTNSDLAIELIHAAVMFSFLSRQYDEFEVHLTSLKVLIDSLGGINAIKDGHSSRYLNAERIRGLYLLKKPLVRVTDWDPGNWFEEDKFRPYDEMYERGRPLMSGSDQPLLPESPYQIRVQNLILDHRDMLTAGSVAAICARTKRPGLEMVIRWMCFRSHALTIRTGEIVGEITSVKQSQPAIELSLHASACLAANFIAHLIHFSWNPTVGLSYVPFPILTKNLREVAVHLELGAPLLHPELYLWTLFVGACAELASRTWSCDPNFRGSTWCSTHFAYMIEQLEITTPEDLKARLRRLLFPFMLESYLRVLFNKRHELIKLAVGI